MDKRDGERGPGMGWRAADEDTQQIRRPHLIMRAAKPAIVISTVGPNPSIESPDARPTCKLAQAEIDGIIAGAAASATDLHVSLELMTSIGSEAPTTPGRPAAFRPAHTLKRTPVNGIAQVVRPRLVGEPRALPEPPPELAAGSAITLVPPVTVQTQVVDPGTGDAVIVAAVTDPSSVEIVAPMRSPSPLRDLALGLAIGGVIIAVAAAVLAVL